jgi:hypothetical protein
MCGYIIPGAVYCLLYEGGPSISSRETSAARAAAACRLFCATCLIVSKESSMLLGENGNMSSPMFVMFTTSFILVLHTVP